MIKAERPKRTNETLKNTLWGGLGMAIPLTLLELIHRQTGMPHALPFGWAVVWFGGLVLSILLLRLMDIVLKDLFLKQPALERFISGLVIGCWIFAGFNLHK